MRIRDWWYAILVCRKYGIYWNPFHHLRNAEFVFRYWNNCRRWRGTIHINPFYGSAFLDSFMHEVGHLVRMRNVYLKSDSIKSFEYSISDILVEEFQAWRYAKLARKNKFNSNRSKKCFKTYFPRYVKDVGCALKAADVYYKFHRRI